MEQITLPFDLPVALITPDEIYQNAEGLLNLINESRFFDRKSSRIHPRTLGESFSMWANTVPEGGLIAVGVENDGSIGGCRSLDSSELNQLEQSGRTYCPDARNTSRLVPVLNAKGHQDFILLIRVHYRPDKVVYDSQGNAYTRVGDVKHHLTKEQCRELEIDKGQVDYEQEPVANVRYPEDFDLDLVSQFAKAFRKSRGISESKPDEQILALRHLGAIQGTRFVPNVACVLAFAIDPRKNFPGCRIRFRRFEGEHEQTGVHYNAVKDYWAEGPLPAIIARAAEILESQIREFSVLGKDGRFAPVSEYPHDAWFEAIVNACVHRSYGMKHMHTTVEMFYDRLVIESPGAFPPFVTPENIYDTQHARNPHLMDAMSYLGFVKFANEGTKRIRSEMIASNLPEPLFQQQSVAGGYSVRVTLQNNYKKRQMWIDSEVATILGETISKGLTPEEARAVNFVNLHGRINVSQFHGLVSSTIKTWHTCRNILFRLQKRGILKYIHREDILRDPDAHFVLDKNFCGNGKH